jgi:hypothetical protein
VEGGSCNDYEYVCGDPINQFDLTGEGFCPLGSIKYVDSEGKKREKCRGKGVAAKAARVGGTVATWTGRGAAVAGVAAVVVGTGGTAGAFLLAGSVALGAASTGASVVQLATGAAVGDKCAVKNGAIGATLGAVTLGTYGAVRDPLVGASEGVIAGTNAFAAVSRQGVYEASGATSC